MVWAIIVIVLLTGADQLFKTVVMANIPVGGSITVIDGFFYLVNRRNSGAAWSFLADQNWAIYLLIGISSIMSLVILALIWKSRNVKLRACLAVICAGSLGNLIDRIQYLGVTDYLDFHFGSYVFPTFNLADSLVVCGAGLLALLILTDRTLLPDRKHNKVASQNEENPHVDDPSD